MRTFIGEVKLSGPAIIIKPKALSSFSKTGEVSMLDQSRSHEIFLNH